MDNTDFDDILWNGDVNYDMSRNSGFARTVKAFLKRVGLGLYTCSH